MLMENLGTAEPHFIRCLKPNQHKARHEYEDDMVKNQLRYTGLALVTFHACHLLTAPSSRYVGDNSYP